MKDKTKDEYKKELQHIQSQINIVKRLDIVNTQLHDYNWVFLHPYSQGMDIEILQNIINTNDDAEYNIFKFFARKFLDLRNTIHFIEGFFPTRPYIKDYINPIKESVILCLQKDFRGAICILIPVIEGILRKCLVDKDGEHKKHVTDIKELLKSIDRLTDEYVFLQQRYMKSKFLFLINENAYFDSNQEKQILKKHREYYTIWTNQFRNYMSNNLYLNTKKVSINDSFNRHVIFHFLEDDIDFSFANYLRIYNSIIYLSWAIGLVCEECSILSVANEEVVKYEFANYLNVLFVSESLTDIKSEIYNTELQSFNELLPPEYVKIISKPTRHINRGLSLTDFLKK
ncbi:hypothetical protein [Carboxylicivirga sp. RSCT41]|uniref:hypothetical protein n=1 Tax=Carboxylicivirga agarovorans TaxID=3417570 RepID=UPI003D3506AF